MPSQMHLYGRLEVFRDAAKTEREKGTYFESLAKDNFENVDIQKTQAEKVLVFAEWSEEHGYDKSDIGFDVVANSIIFSVRRKMKRNFRVGGELF